MRQWTLLLLPLLGGCLDRTETITVRPDGSLLVEHTIKGDARDLDAGAARYPDAHHFAVDRRTERNDKGETRTVLTARAEFRKAADVPTRFGPPDDPFGDRALRMTTSLTVRKENGRTFFRFVRTYAPRAWADYAHAWRRAIPHAIRKKLDNGVDLDDMPDDEKRELIVGAVAYERRKMQIWAERALAAVAADHARLVEIQLAARDAVEDYFAERFGYEQVKKILDDPDSIDAVTERTYRELFELVTGLGRDELAADPARLKHVLAAEQHDYDVSEDLEDEKFAVRLRLPGTLLAHNGDQREDGDVIWKFDGEDLRDRRHVLVATSVVD